MPEVLEPPPTSQSDSDALKASFNTALKTETETRPAPAEVDIRVDETKPALIPNEAKPDSKLDARVEESIVPDQFSKKPDEKPALVDEEIPVNAGTKQLRDVLARRDAKLKEQVSLLEDLRKKLESAPVAGPSKEHEEAVRAANERAAKLEQQLERAAYADSPKFQRFNTEHAAEITSAKDYLTGTDISPTVLDVAASQSGQARLKTLRDSGMDAETIAAVGPHLARADAIRRERDASLDNWKQEHTKETEAQRLQQTRQEQERQVQEQAVLKQVSEEKTKNHPAYTEVEGHPKWNEMVKKNKQDAEDFAMGKKPLKELFEIGFDGIGARTTKLMYEDVKTKLDAANAQIARLTAAQPGTGRSVDAKAGDLTKPVDETSEHKAAFNNALAEATGRR